MRDPVRRQRVEDEKKLQRVMQENDAERRKKEKQTHKAAKDKLRGDFLQSQRERNQSLLHAQQDERGQKQAQKAMHFSMESVPQGAEGEFISQLMHMCISILVLFFRTFTTSTASITHLHRHVHLTCTPVHRHDEQGRDGVHDEGEGVAGPRPGRRDAAAAGETGREIHGLGKQQQQQQQ
jgi:hypothetical protein